MIPIVLDTNVLVSALLSPGGPSHQVVLLVIRGDLQLGVDARIRQEYQEVLTRGKFRFSQVLVSDLLSALFEQAEEVIALPVAESFPDEEDRPFIEVALAHRASALVTGNVRHFGLAKKMGLRVMKPAEFLHWWASQR